jgi:NAD-dependent dihydropyrimidine dehydrogenase PreA subunit
VIAEVNIMVRKTVAVISRDRTRRSEHDVLEKRLVDELSKRKDMVVILSPHLYDLAMDGHGVEILRSVPGDMIVLAWLYPRAAHWLLDAHNIKGRIGPTSSLPEDDVEQSARRPREDAAPERTIWCFDLRRYKQTDRLLGEIHEILASVSAEGELDAMEGADGHVRQIEEETRPRWYPVIDYQRCNNCLECLNFCLFGVYSLDADNAITAEAPDACRPGCPACSRVCPEGAIMFPQHKDPGIAGDPKASLAGLKLDLSQLMAGMNPVELAKAERERALAEKQAEDAKPAAKDNLDRLVDELDELDL